MNLDFQQEMAVLRGEDTKTTSKTHVSKRRKKKNKPKVDISNNAIYQIESDPSLSREGKKEALVDLLSYKSAEEAAASKAAMDEYTSWMQAQRQDMASKLIEMNDTGTFSNLQKVLGDVNGDLLDFEKRIAPFMEIISAVRKLQEGDLITDAIAEIEEQKELVAKLEEDIDSISLKVSRTKNAIYGVEKDIAGNNSSIERLSADRTWFGFGDITETSKNLISKLESDNKENKDKLDGLNKKVEVLTKEHDELVEQLKNVNDFSELAEEKRILANMLNLNSEEHEQKHAELISAATKFVDTTKERIGETLEKSLGLSDHIGELSNVSYNIKNRYAILAVAAREAEKNNAELHAQLKEEAEKLDDSDQFAKMENEDNQRGLSKYIQALSDSVADNSMVMNDLTIASQRIETLQEANAAQIKKTRSISTSGIAGVADNLSTVLTSIGQTAIGQAAQAAQQSLNRMNQTTIGLTKEQMLNQVKEHRGLNADLARNLESLAGFGEAISIANEATYDALAETRDLVDDLMSTAEEVQETVKDGVEVKSSVIADKMD